MNENEDSPNSASKIKRQYDEQRKHDETYTREFAFCEKVKKTLRNVSAYQEFLKCLQIYSTKTITRSGLQSMVHDLLGGYPDLMDGFKEFLKRCDENGILISFLACHVTSKKSHTPCPLNAVNRIAKDSVFREKVAEILQNAAVYRDFHEGIHNISKESIPESLEDAMIAAVFRYNRDLWPEYYKFLERCHANGFNMNEDEESPNSASKIKRHYDGPALKVYKRRKHDEMYTREFAFCEKVKKTIRNVSAYQEFLKCLQIYSTKTIKRSGLLSMVRDLLGGYPDLMDGFKEFLKRCDENGISISLLARHVMSKMRLVDNKVCISEVDLSNSERCTPSYRLLPKNYPMPSVTKRTELAAEVLNDNWVSVPSGSVGQFKREKKKQWEEMMNKYEDDRFEMDMLIEPIKSAVKCVDELLEKINTNTINTETPIRIEEHFTAMNLRCIERVCGETMELLRKDVRRVLPYTLHCLEQEKAELEKKVRFIFDHRGYI